MTATFTGTVVVPFPGNRRPAYRNRQGHPCTLVVLPVFRADAGADGGRGARHRRRRLAQAERLRLDDTNLIPFPDATWFS